jgi:hypothetical protein
LLVLYMYICSDYICERFPEARRITVSISYSLMMIRVV